MQSPSSHPRNDPQKLVGPVRMLRIRVATAESKVKQLREEARRARRRRKEAKRLAQRARRQFKRFKADLADLRESLANAEAKLFQAGGRALARKWAKAKAVANRGARPSRKPKAAVPKPQPAVPRASRAPGRVARKKPVIKKTKAVVEIPADVAALDPTPSTPQIPNPNS